MCKHRSSATGASFSRAEFMYVNQAILHEKLSPFHRTFDFFMFSEVGLRVSMSARFLRIQHRMNKDFGEADTSLILFRNEQLLVSQYVRYSLSHHNMFRQMYLARRVERTTALGLWSNILNDVRKWINLPLNELESGNSMPSKCTKKRLETSLKISK